MKLPWLVSSSIREPINYVNSHRIEIARNHAHSWLGKKNLNLDRATRILWLENSRNLNPFRLMERDVIGIAKEGTQYSLSLLHENNFE